MSLSVLSEREDIVSSDPFIGEESDEDFYVCTSESDESDASDADDWGGMGQMMNLFGSSPVTKSQSDFMNSKKEEEKEENEKEEEEKETAVKETLKRYTLIKAAERGKIKTVRRLLAEGSDINAVDEANNTPLIWALRNGHLRVASVLLRVPGVRVRCSNSSGKSALSYAQMFCSDSQDDAVGVLRALEVSLELL